MSDDGNDRGGKAASHPMSRGDFLKAVTASGLAAGSLSALPTGFAGAQQAPGRGGGGRGGTQEGRPRLLIWADTRNGISQHASVSHAMSVIERLGYESGAYDAFIRTDSHIISKNPQMTTGRAASGGPSLANVDGIFFLGHREVPLDDAQKADLLSFVRDDGKGFVAAHTATTAFESWPEFGELIGGRYDGHPWGNSDGVVINEDPLFPATRHLPASFELRDEFYQTSAYSRDDIRVVLRLDVSRMPETNGLNLTNGDFPLAWAKAYGRGRVFYSSFGHAPETWDDPRVATMYFEAVKWSLGLTDADVTPRPFAAPGGGGRGGGAGPAR
jgi:hypothetical protein